MTELELRKNFHEAVEKLKTVHTREELEETKKEIYRLRDELINSSESYKQELENRKSAIKGEAEKRFSAIKERTKNFNIPTLLAPAMMDNRLRMLNQEMIDRRRPKIAVGQQLVCPECGETDMGNIKSFGRGKKKKKQPWCFKCDIALVPMDKIDKWKGAIKLRKKFTEEERKMGYGK